MFQGSLAGIRADAQLWENTKVLHLKHTKKEESAGQDAGTVWLGFCFYLLSMPKWVGLS